MENKNLVIILDAAHGIDVMGKCSPDGTHREYNWSRQRCEQLKEMLEPLGYTVHLNVPETTEPGLINRVKRANAFPGTKKLLLSLHNNAAGNGIKWMSARGIEAFTTKGQTKSDVCATKILQALASKFHNLTFRQDWVDGDPDKENNWTVLMGNYMAVLIEWCFQDNKEDVAILKDDVMNERFCQALVQAIEILNETV